MYGEYTNAPLNQINLELLSAYPASVDALPEPEVVVRTSLSFVKPKVQDQVLYSRILSKWIRVKVSTEALRLMDKMGGLDRYIMASSIKHMGGPKSVAGATNDARKAVGKKWRGRGFSAKVCTGQKMQELQSALNASLKFHNSQLNQFKVAVELEEELERLEFGKIEKDLKSVSHSISSFILQYETLLLQYPFSRFVSSPSIAMESTTVLSLEAPTLVSPVHMAAQSKESLEKLQKTLDNCFQACPNFQGQAAETSRIASKYAELQQEKIELLALQKVSRVELDNEGFDEEQDIETLLQEIALFKSEILKKTCRSNAMLKIRDPVYKAMNETYDDYYANSKRFINKAQDCVATMASNWTSNQTVFAAAEERSRELYIIGKTLQAVVKDISSPAQNLCWIAESESELARLRYEHELTTLVSEFCHLTQVEISKFSSEEAPDSCMSLILRELLFEKLNKATASLETLLKSSIDQSTKGLDSCSDEILQFCEQELSSDKPEYLLSSHETLELQQQVKVGASELRKLVSQLSNK